MSSTPSGRARGGAFCCGYSILRNGDYFFTFWQKFIRIVATCWQLNSTNSVLLYRSSEVCLLKPQLSTLRL